MIATKTESSSTDTAAPFVVASPDGRSFTATTDADAELRAGDYLLIGGPDGDQLAMVEAVTANDHAVVGVGTLLGSPGSGPPAPFRGRSGRPSDPAHIIDFLADSRSTAQLGRLVAAPDVPVGIQTSKMNRHTFWCGQSGSGKTYALGVALEQILLRTELPMVIFDPNSDFVRLNETLPSASPEDRARLADRDIRILRPGEGPDSLRVRFRSMTPRARAAILQLDPVVNMHEYNVLGQLDLHDDEDPRSLVTMLEDLGTPEAHRLAARLQNLEIFSWRTWSRAFRPATEIVADRPAATVLDLGSFQRIEEQLTVSLAVLDDLWARREERRPVLLVIDEAHNLCSPDLESALGRAVRDRLIQIAAEGRKFGLWLLLSTQRPSKVHPGIVSQCDNLTLMRMNSPGDLKELSRVFGFVPRAMLNQAARFRQGEALVAGGFVSGPSIVKVGDRLTVEGGIDVKVPMPAPAS